MHSKNFTICKVDKRTEDFYNKNTESKFCNSNRSLKRYYQNKDKLSTRKKF